MKIEPGQLWKVWDGPIEILLRNPLENPVNVPKSKLQNDDIIVVLERTELKNDENDCFWTCMCREQVVYIYCDDLTEFSTLESDDT